MKINPLYIHVPAQLLPSQLPFLLKRKLQPEVACHDVALDNLDFDLLADCAMQLCEQGLSTTLHAPYNGFNPASSKKRDQKLSHHIADTTLLLAEKLNARRIVFHPGLTLGSSANDHKIWLEQSIDFWPELVAYAQQIDCIICIENIYETSPELFLLFLSTINSPYLGHVFDIGHWNIYGTTTLISWLEQIGPYVKHLHLHDNSGKWDQHLPLGQGNAPITELLSWLKMNQIVPTMTLENHSLEDIENSLQTIFLYYPELLV